MKHSICRTALSLAAAGLAVTVGCAGGISGRPERATPELREESLRVLRTALKELNSPEHRWARVHAAEMLLALDYPQDVQEVFTQELNSFGDVPQYRIGIWRVLSRVARAGGNDPWFDQIVAAMVDPAGPDRQHAVETLGKLGRSIPPAAEQVARQLASVPEPAMSAFAAWVVTHNDRDAGLQLLAKMLSSGAIESRRLAAYALRFQTKLNPDLARTLVQMARQEPADSAARPYLLSAAFVHAPTLADRRQLRPMLLGYLRSGTEAQRHEAANALAIGGGPEDIAVLRGLLTSPEPDSRIGAAYAILRIERRASSDVTARLPGN